MDIRKLQRAIVDGLEDVKAQNIVVFNTEHLSPLFERVIIASGTSNRQTKALASSVRETVKGRGMQVMRTEGEDNGEWIIVDCGAAVVHLMQPAIRTYYHLEEIWGGKPVKLKLGSSETKLVKASEEPAAAPVKTARKGTASKPITAKAAPKPAPKAAPAKGANRAVPSAAAKKAVAKKAAVGTQAPKKGVTRSVGVKTAAPVKTLTVGAGQGVGKAAAAKRAKPAAKAAPAARPAAKTAGKTAAKAASRAPAKRAAPKKG
ncbi:ribosome silencing factor [Roseateles sp.]|uniref:ribosome silencing factor n=1 Tax=Roseateles sp. TaxID=1971397 RepID=UPI003BAC0085